MQLLPLLLSTLLAGNVTAVDTDPRLKMFAAQKRQQAEELSSKLHLTMTPKVLEFFRAAEAGDASAVTNCFPKLRSRIEERDVGLTNVLWCSVSETGAAYEQFGMWDGAMLQKHADGILGSIPAGSIYFGGTLPGRFIITAVRDVAKSPDIFIITQNGMQDICYLDYLRLLYGGRIWIPSEEDAQQAFQQGAESGTWLAEIAGTLTKMIFENNKARHEFFIEQGVVIPWMYPYLEPHGLIMKLNKEPLAELDPAIITRDRQFWDGLTKELLTDPRFLHNEPARETYAKLRSAIGDLYAYRGLTNETEAVFKQALELGPKTVMPAFRLAQFCKDAGRYDEAVAVLEQFHNRLSASDPWRQHAIEAIEHIREPKRQ